MILNTSNDECIVSCCGISIWWLSRAPCTWAATALAQVIARRLGMILFDADEPYTNKWVVVICELDGCCISFWWLSRSAHCTCAATALAQASPGDLFIERR
jgi:hypothetical protein